MSPIMPIFKILFPAKSTKYQSLKERFIPGPQTEHYDYDVQAYETTEVTFTRSSKNPILLILLAILLLSSCSLALGILVGIKISLAAPPQTQGMLKFKVYEIENYYKAHPELGGPPSYVSNIVWWQDSPPDGGYFRDEALAPAGASLAVYHQLHCLDAIRHSYWAIHNAVGNRSVTFSFANLPDRHKPDHISHCIDYLRQMLMCNADLTIEHLSTERHGRAGFGGAHQCVNWTEITNWTLQRQETWFSQHGASPSLSDGDVEDV